MQPFRSSSWLPLASVLVLAIVGVGGLMLGVAGDRKGMQALPDAVGSTVDVLHDPVANFTWAGVHARPDSDWQRWSNHGYIQAFFGEAVWVRITLKNPSPQPMRGVLADAEYYTDRIDLWTPDSSSSGGWRHERAGEWVPAADKAIWGRDAAFFVTVPARGERVVTLRLQDYFGVWLRPVWWPDERAFLGAQLRDTLAEWCYFGVLLALFIYNGVIWARLRYRDLGYYLGYLSSIAVFMFFARCQHQLLGWAIGSPVMETILTTALAASCVFIVQFAREFMTLRTLAPRADLAARIMRTLMIVLTIGALAMPWSNNTLWLHLTIAGTSATHAVLLVAAIAAWRGGVIQARYFVFSFGVLLIGILPATTIWLLSIPLGISALAMMTGSALEMLLLSLALSDRFARLQRDTESARLSEEKTRLELLRYQLNPHFLFNALNSIYGLVYPHSRSAGDLVRKLADFCRVTFSHEGNQWRPLFDELAMLRMYLDIEQARWRERLVIEFAPDPAVADQRLPAFLLLPLVENAIKHGGATSPGVLTVRIITRPGPAGTVEIEVANTGRWQPPEEPRSVPSTGIGLENVRARLHRSFPGSHQLDISTREGWVSVTLRLPRSRPAPP